ncbi:MAG TPA: tetratricopeptide repeat protein [Pyrinomonadaceae bacterium]|nr:tetratricopeptide repeat protein [Pyrinomonadaceae bacterium]
MSAKDTWVSVRTKNFFMVGNANEKEIRNVALKLEQFRAVFIRVFPDINFNTPVPTTVIVFKSHDSYGPFKPGANVAGHFQAGQDVNYIALSTEERGRLDAFTVIFHEYTHLLVNNTFENAPAWFDEGLAEYYSTFSITDDQKVIIGRNVGNHVLLLREKKMLPLRTLFDVDHKSPHYNEANKKSIFYAQSWALMHYLIVGKQGRDKQLGKFLTLLDKMPREQAFQQAFEMSYEEMEKELRQYVQQYRFNELIGHFERKLQLDASAQATTLTEAEAQAYLGDLLLHSRRADAEKYLKKALELDPNLGMAHASMGMLRFYEGKADEARASLERAVAGNSQNYLAHYYYAFTLSRQRPGEKAESYTPEQLAKIREHLQRAIALRPDYPESYSLLAFVSLVSRQGIDEAIESMKLVLAALPGRQDFALMLAQLYLNKQDYKAARRFLEQVAKSNAEDEVIQGAEQLLGQLDTYEKQLAEYEAAKKAAESRRSSSEPDTSELSIVQTTPATPSDPSSHLREVLRTPAAGETQLQTKLIGIECDAKGMIFVVQAPSGELRLKARSFEDIELTTYSPDVKGEIGCGPRKPENVVIVCYLPNSDKRVKVDGVLKSIEFVPTNFKLKP